MSYKVTYYNKKTSRKSVPKSLKDKLWDTTFGPEAGEGYCYVCDEKINSKRFEAGHIISVFNNGRTILSNLKCICSTCNKSMGTQDLEEFRETYFPDSNIYKKEKYISTNLYDSDDDINMDKLIGNFDKMNYIEKKNKKETYISKDLYESDNDVDMNVLLDSLNKFKFVEKI